MEKLLLMLALLSITVVVLSGCISEGRGVLVLQITDAPPELDISKAMITISNVEVHLIATGWYTVFNESQTFDLIAIKNAKEFLGSVNLSAGHYSQIRLHISAALVTIDGVEYDLEIPSKKINLISPFRIEANKTTTLTLDFDVHKSIHSTGQNEYIIRPTIKIIKE